MPKNMWSRLWRATDGLGAVEFGFIAPVLLVLILGILDFGMAFWEQMQISNAADAGAQWAMSNTFNATSITSITQHATNLSSVQVDPAPQQVCGCPRTGGTGVDTGYGTAPSSCTTCPDGTAAKTYVVVNTRICYSTFFTWPGLTYCSAGNTSCTGCSTSQIALTAQSMVLQ